jgi:hypothetical protein
MGSGRPVLLQLRSPADRGTLRYLAARPASRHAPRQITQSGPSHSRSNPKTMSQPSRIELTEESVPQPTRPASQHDPAIARTIAVLDLTFGPPSQRNYDIKLWDGTVQRGGISPAADFSILIRRRGAMRRMLLPPTELTIVEALISGDVEMCVL